MRRPISTAGMLLMVLGAMGVVAALVAMHRASPDRAARFTPSRDLSEAVADPDMPFTPPIRAYAE